MWGRPPAAWQDILGAGKVTAPSVFYPALALAPERAEVGKAEPLEVERALEVGGGSGWESEGPGETLGKLLPTLELRSHL